MVTAGNGKTIRAILVNDTSESGHFGCRIVVDQIRRLAVRHGIEIAATCPKGMPYDQLCRMIRGYQLCLVNGEGTIHHSAPAGLTLVRIGTFCKSIGVPSVLLNAQYQANGPEFDRHVRDFDLVFVRDQLSLDELDGVPARVVPDLVLSADLGLPAVPRGENLLVTDHVNKSQARRLFEISRRVAGPGRFLAMESLHPRYRQTGGVAGVVRNSAVALDFRLKKHLIGGVAGLVGEHLPGYLQFKAAMYRGCEQERFLEELNRCRLFISGRFHGVCLAMLLRTPFVALASNSFKLEGLLAAAGLRHRLVARVEEIRPLLSSLDRFSEQELQGVSALIHRAVRGADGMFADIRRLMP